MNKKILFSAIVFTALSLAGCSKEESARFSGYIGCKVFTSAATKAVESNQDSLEASGFIMTAVIDDDANEYDTDGSIIATYPRGAYFQDSYVSISSGKWSISGNPKWVLHDSIRFWCWTESDSLVINPSNAALEGSNTLDFRFSTAEGGQVDASGNASDAKSQKDLLFAYNSAYRNGTSNEKNYVDFYFYHALSQIRFCVRAEDGTVTSGDGKYNADLTIHDIALHDVFRKGDCVMTGAARDPLFTWSNQNKVTNYTQFFKANFQSSNGTVAPSGWDTSYDADGNIVYTAQEAFFIVPQTIGPTTSIVINFDGGYFMRSVPLKGVGNITRWEPGKYYTYCIAISYINSDPVIFDISLNDWASTGHKIRF